MCVCVCGLSTKHSCSFAELSVQHPSPSIEKTQSFNKPNVQSFHSQQFLCQKKNLLQIYRFTCVKKSIYTEPLRVSFTYRINHGLLSLCFFLMHVCACIYVCCVHVCVCVGQSLSQVFLGTPLVFKRRSFISQSSGG